MPLIISSGGPQLRAANDNQSVIIVHQLALYSLLLLNKIFHLFLLFILLFITFVAT